MLLYKVTDQDHPEIGSTRHANERTFRTYRDPRLALLLALADEPRVWEVDVPCACREEDAAVRASEVTFIRELQLPCWFLEDPCRWGVLIAAAYVDEVMATHSIAADIVRCNKEIDLTLAQSIYHSQHRSRICDDWSAMLLQLEKDRRQCEDVSFGLARLLVILSNAFTILTGSQLDHGRLISAALV